MKGKLPVGLSLPHKPYLNPGRSAGQRLDKRLVDAYREATGKEPGRFTEGLAKAQWEYGLQGTQYYTKAARQDVLTLTVTAS